MNKIYDKPIIIQKVDEETERWRSIYTLHAHINKSKKGDEFLSAGAIQSKQTLTFDIRYFKNIEDISLNTQLYRVLYNGHIYDISDYDDFMFKHKNVRLLGVAQ
ncbi:phage head closure protein [Peptostreptococcus sp. D1]|uniref:phage head closure protein n=1 Tax=Peptostreptococcus sp. D1 TaxID=72304 RepID=UPI0008E5C439|nr:phage head closure protein [Peptostreptococcus sp. D1]SFE84082.1 phage head-tail adaptor, putative, SPP1 family [Peptostreptococcus sp. D1]